MYYDLFDLENSPHFKNDPLGLTKIAFISQDWRPDPTKEYSFASHTPVLGLLSIASSVREFLKDRLNFNIEFKYFDNLQFKSPEELHDSINDYFGNCERKIVAATSYSWTVERLQGFLLRFDPLKHLIIIGGPHATLEPNITSAHIIIRGEGGTPFIHVLEHIFSDFFFDPENLKGICYKYKGDRVINKQQFDDSILTQTSPPFAYDILPKKVLYNTNFQRKLGSNPFIYVCTQSCKARCSFCSTYLIHGKFISRPTNLIKKDLNHLKNNLKCDSLEFHDDDLLQHPQFLQLVSILKEINIPWFCYARADQITNKLSREMANANCKRVFLGLESMNQEKLDYFNKNTSISQNEMAISALEENNIRVIAGFIVGTPQDNLQSLFDEFDIFKNTPISFQNISVLSPDPGTAEFFKYQKFINTHGPNHGFCKNITPTELRFIRTLFESEHYFRDSVFNKLSQESISWNFILKYYRSIYKTIINYNTDLLNELLQKRYHDFLDNLDKTHWEELLGL